MHIRLDLLILLFYIIFWNFRSEQQLVASQERRRQEQDPNEERARVGQKTDIIIALPTGPALEGFICEVSGGLPAGCPKKIWTDKLKLMVGMRDMINRVIKTFPGLLPIDYMKVIVFGCQVIGKYILRSIEISDRRLLTFCRRLTNESLCNGCPNFGNLSFWND